MTRKILDDAFGIGTVARCEYGDALHTAKVTR
jgi:hypothetical protein